MYGNYNVHFKLHVHGRMKFYRRPLVAHPCLMLFEQAICLVKNVFHLFFPKAKFFIDDLFFTFEVFGRFCLSLVFAKLLLPLFIKICFTIPIRTTYVELFCAVLGI